MENKPTWHGVDRESIPWFPTVDAKQCIGCELCFITCGKGVYEMEEVDGRQKAKAVLPFACMVGCSTCANICPTHAISFPDPSIVLAVEREYEIFSTVHKEANKRREKQRSKALESCECIKRQTFEIAGEVERLCDIDELREIVLPYECDIVEFSISIPSLVQHKKGAPGVAKMTLIGRDIERASSLLSDKIVAKELVIVKK